MSAADAVGRKSPSPRMLENRELHVFANALREMLGLDPLYEDGRSLRRKAIAKEGTMQKAA